MSHSLIAHPRLYVGQEDLDRLSTPARHFPLDEAERRAAKRAEDYCGSPVIDYEPEHHNALLIRAREMQGRIVTLLTRWHQTGEARFRAAAMAHLREMASWEYWSWISLRQGDPRPEANYDLSHGENAATLALAWDWLHPTLSVAERELILGMVRRWVVHPFLENTSRDRPPHWYRNSHSNWNTVCCGGACMAALAMHEELGADANAVLEQMHHSTRPYFETMGKTQGGWEEGVGYWNYGMRYAFMALLSWERAHDAEHAFMALPGVAETLDFPLDFAPYAVGCSFGDVNRWKPLPFHYALAERFDRPDVTRHLDELLRDTGAKSGGWPDEAEMLLLHPRDHEYAASLEEHIVAPYAKKVPSLEWCVLADQWPNPNLYLSVRGGDTEVAHGHTDLLSFHCMVDGEKLVTHAAAGGYHDATFSPRRYELYQMTPSAVNTLLINGLGVQRPATVAAELIEHGEVRGVRLDATEAMGAMRDGPVARFAGRLILLLGPDAALVIDQVRLHQYGRVESRFHTSAELTLGDDRADIRGTKARATLTFASDVQADLHYGIDPLTTPTPVFHMARWVSKKLVHDATLAALISRDPEARIEIADSADGPEQTVAATAANRHWTVALDNHLRPRDINATET